MGASKRKKSDSKTKGLKCSICICDCRIKTHPMSSSRIGSVGSNDPFGALTDKLKESKKNIIKNTNTFVIFSRTLFLNQIGDWKNHLGHAF